MRVTSSMLTTSVVRDLTRSLERLKKTQEQLSSGKQVSQPEDNPIALARILSFRGSIQEAEQYSSNMRDATGWLDATDQALDGVTQVLQRVRELTVQGANGTQPRQSLNIIADEVGQLAEELLQQANTSYAGRYLFAGSRTTSPPFSLDQVNEAVIYNADNKDLKWPIAPGVNLTVNQQGEKAFEVDSLGKSELFATVLAIKKALQEGNQNELSGSLLGDLDANIDQVLSRRAEVGARSRRLELVIQRAAQNSINLTGLLSKLEDVDFAKATMDFQLQQNVYQAALATAAKIILPSLVEFLS